MRSLGRRIGLAGAVIAGCAWACAGCGSAGPGGGEGARATADPEGMQRRAVELAHEIPIVDTHIDVPYRLREKMEDISMRTESGDFDYPRAKEGGLDAAFMSIYIPAEFQEDRNGGARRLADDLIDMVEGFESQWPDKFRVARSVDDVLDAHARGLIALPLGMENGAAIESNLDNLRHFQERGIRYITLTHSEDNQICDSSYAKTKRWKGLSPFGREVVAEMNRLGIMIDISHVSDDTFYQVMDLSRAPVIASHSSCRHYTEGWERNMDDAMIRLLGEKGGVIQINFGSAFLDPEAHVQSMAYWNEVEELKKSRGLKDDDPEIKEFREHYWDGKERLYADITDVVDHIDHVVAIAGVDHVGFGSDFDGVGDSLPTGLKSVGDYPNLIRILMDRGYTDDEIRGIAGGNLMRVWSAVARVAAESAPVAAH